MPNIFLKPSAYASAVLMAERGIPVFPCRANKRPATRHGFKDATCEPDTLKCMFDGLPDSLIGMPCGQASGLDLLDIDPRHGGGDWLADCAPYLPDTLTVQTRSGGTHFFFRHLPGMRNSESRIAPGVDVRGEGGYAILWATSGGFVVRDVPVTDWPEWLAAIALPSKDPPPPPAATQRALRHLDNDDMVVALTLLGRALYQVETAPAGQRHYRLRAAARTIGGLIDGAGITTDDAATALLDAVGRAGAKDMRGAAETVAWGLSKGRAAPLILECAA